LRICAVVALLVVATANNDWTVAGKVVLQIISTQTSRHKLTQIAA